MNSTARIPEKHNQLRFIGVTKDAVTAGPGKRLELFLKGCIRGIINPCEGCFNPTTWEFGGLRRDMYVQEVVDLIVRDAWNWQVTFCGGEPLLQTRNLIKVCRALKERDPRFHIVVYTAYTLENLLNQGIVFHYKSVKDEEERAQVKEALDAYSRWDNKQPEMKIIVKEHEIRELMKHIDLLVDGDYQSDKRIPTEQFMNEGMFVGSSNQRVIDTKETLQRDPKFVFEYADHWMRKHLTFKHCKCCGHPLRNRAFTYCDRRCRKAWHKRNKDMAVFGGA
ncbi:4Fe-4S single cluster domain-containing protein [Paenibacillus sp. UNC496MF]|uniref:4Fe-4S single cluster domain-containing protein n=1 Tax=Paenibacillus sp. UNC496MF TaxID=1502753 RepID=UPI0008E3A663|nr:4Fe-4S single cluster domain-containing protein [Paenibacillus sp. UNC496MF]SFJ63767.1 4Fe-4S single cluster domain-containing protein [Paenibacillus sp. UNC496MF]